MGAIEHLTISLPAEMADKVRGWVADGEFSDFDAAVLIGLQGLDAGESAASKAEEDEFIRRVVLPAIDGYDADPSRGLSVEQVREHLSRSS